MFEKVCQSIGLGMLAVKEKMKGGAGRRAQRLQIGDIDGIPTGGNSVSIRQSHEAVSGNSDYVWGTF
jgi:hypothetical protein